MKKNVDYYLKLREEIRNASGETLDMKTYEADMRHLIDTYIQAEEPRTISPFARISLLDLLVNSGIADAINSLPEGIKRNKEAVAETIENNVRKKIIQEHLTDPAYFEEMSKLLHEIVKERKANAINYEAYLKKIAELAKKVNNPAKDNLPERIKNSNARRALYNNLNHDEELAVVVDEAVRCVKKADWRGNNAKKLEIKKVLYDILNDENEVERIFRIMEKQEEY